MVPPLHGYTLSTLDIRWVPPGLGVTVIVFSVLGVRAFYRRVVN